MNILEPKICPFKKRLDNLALHYCAKLNAKSPNVNLSIILILRLRYTLLLKKFNYVAHVTTANRKFVMVT